MAKKTEITAKKKPIEQYDHEGTKPPNNPPLGLADVKSDPGDSKKTYAYDPHLDPTLIWAGKAERTSFEIPTVAKNLRAEIDETLVEAYRGTVSLPFPFGKQGRVAVKIVDDRGIESLKILEMQ